MSDDSFSDADPEDLRREEASSLLPTHGSDAQPQAPKERSCTRKKPLPDRRQSSLSQSLQDGLPRTPRTTNRVRFEVEDRESREHEQNGHFAEPALQFEEGGEAETYFSYGAEANGRRSINQRAPLLTGIEAPSITVATTDLDFNAEDLLESSRPKSGMKSAFMNMANSIMYVWHHHGEARISSPPMTDHHRSGAGIIGAVDRYPLIIRNILSGGVKDNHTLFGRPD
ncbi:MAG: hypothetical protein Q9216_004078 [Gyalolechia sp. 2 TL-2023]